MIKTTKKIYIKRDDRKNGMETFFLLFQSFSFPKRNIKEKKKKVIIIINKIFLLHKTTSPNKKGEKRVFETARCQSVTFADTNQANDKTHTVFE